MTTIAANRERMVADSFVNDGNRTVKIMKGVGIVVGYAGSLFYGSQLAKWVLEGARGAPPHPGDDKRDDVELLILRKTGLSMMDGRGFEVPLDGEYASIGSGSDVALGAMWAGATPEAAVEAAAYHDSTTKLPVHIVTLKRK